MKPSTHDAVVIATIPARVPFPRFEFRRAPPADERALDCCWVVLDDESLQDEAFVRQTAVNCIVSMSHMGLKVVILALEAYEKSGPTGARMCAFLRDVRSAFARIYLTELDAPVTYTTEISPGEASALAVIFDSFASIESSVPKACGVPRVPSIGERLREFFAIFARIVPYDIADLHVASIIHARFSRESLTITFDTQIGARRSPIKMCSNICATKKKMS